jgi:hypothetical protein
MKKISIALLACLATSVAGAAGGPVVRGGGNGVYHSPPLDHDVMQTLDGTTLNFVSGAFDDTGPISGDWDINFWATDSASQLAFFLVDDYHVEFVVDGNGDAAVLQPGDTVGAASTFADFGDPSPDWLAGVDGYLGVKFDCDGRLANPVPSGTCFGYVHLIAGASDGFPATVADYS